MIYLTGQLLFFLLISAFLGFLIGWLLRGAMLPLSVFNGKDIIYMSESTIEPHSNAVNQGYQPLRSYTSPADDTP
jgi:hypothetical protein